MSVMTLMVGAILGIAIAYNTSQKEEAQRGSNRPIRVLIITGGHDFEREPFFAMFKAMPGIEWKEAIQPAANNLYTKEEAQKYDVIVLYDFVQEITEAQKQNLVRLLKEEGKGLVALHHSIGNYQNWAEYRCIIGGRYYLSDRVEDGVEHKRSTYHHDQRFTVQIADPKHPITKGLKDFEMVDETYNGFTANPGVKVLLRANHPESAPVIGWAHQYGKARVAYIQLGHDSAAYNNPNYRQLVLNAIRWVAK